MFLKSTFISTFAHIQHNDHAHTGIASRRRVREAGAIAVETRCPRCHRQPGLQDSKRLGDIDYVLHARPLAS